MTKQNLVKMVCDKCGKTETLESYRQDVGWYNVHLKSSPRWPENHYLSDFEIDCRIADLNRKQSSVLHVWMSFWLLLETVSSRNVKRWKGKERRKMSAISRGFRLKLGSSDSNSRRL